MIEPNTLHFQVVPFDSIRIPVDSVVRRLGYAHGDIDRIDTGIRMMVEEEMRSAEGFLAPRGVCRFLDVDSRLHDEIAFRNTPFRIHSRQVTRMLAGSDPVVLFMVTIGPELEAALGRLLKDGEITRAFILDAIGSETADALADDLHWNRIQESAEHLGFMVTPRFSPGYGDWPLTVQTDLAAQCGGERIGISVTPSSLMLPQKSVSAVLGWNRKG
ncbi:MAG TPA: vitamin B12 dependent-methionine synthase activation domain-containing protein [bacterium]